MPYQASEDGTCFNGYLDSTLIELSLIRTLVLMSILCRVVSFYCLTIPCNLALLIWKLHFTREDVQLSSDA